MKNKKIKLDQKISTKLGTIVLVIFAITAGVFVWLVEKNQQAAERPLLLIGAKKPTLTQQDVPQEFPTIPAQSGMSIEDIIKRAIYEKYPDWKNRNYNITVTVETNMEDHAIGRFVFDGYNIVKDGKYHNTGEEIWFAAESNKSWTLVVTSYPSYWGSCQDFKKYNFSTDMTPDCWDVEKNILINTLNPARFYPKGFVATDKKKLAGAFIAYMQKVKDSGQYAPESYFSKDLYVKADKIVGNYLSGTMLVGGSQNISTPYFLATKQNGKWIVVHNGQDIPICSAIEPYKFPHEIISSCYDDINKKEKAVL
jgi:hypothetical protein